LIDHSDKSETSNMYDTDTKQQSFASTCLFFFLLKNQQKTQLFNLFYVYLCWINAKIFNKI